MEMSMWFRTKFPTIRIIFGNSNTKSTAKSGMASSNSIQIMDENAVRSISHQFAAISQLFRIIFFQKLDENVHPESAPCWLYPLQTGMAPAFFRNGFATSRTMSPSHGLPDVDESHTGSYMPVYV